jgi:phosphoribosylformimino-5-aminoimidazole carboxamide ribotide isomerase
LTSAFEILPAIDLRGGRVVRLEQGDFERETAFSDDPVTVARSFVAAGARWLHVVDLDGARSGEPAHGGVIADIVAAVADGASLEVAGGLRSAGAVAAVLDAGAARAVVGTAALVDPDLAGRLVRTHGADRIAVAIDVRGGVAVGQGWIADAAGVDAETAVRDLVDRGVRCFEVTAIDRDGLLGGPDLALYGRLLGALGSDASIIASAGIASIRDVEAVRAVGCSGAIVGRALYDGSLDLAEALAAIGRGAASEARVRRA